MHITRRRSHRYSSTRVPCRAAARVALSVLLVRFRVSKRAPSRPSHPPTFSLTRTNLVPRVAGFARSSRMLRAVQRSACPMATLSTVSRAVRSWRHSPGIREDRGGSRVALTRVWEHCFTDLFSSNAPQTEWKIPPVQIIREN